jgi:hypothetical protein
MTCQNCSRKETCQLKTPYEEYLENKKERETVTLSLDQAFDLTIAVFDDVNAGNKTLEEAHEVMRGIAELLDPHALAPEGDPFADIKDFQRHFESKKVVPP